MPHTAQASHRADCAGLYMYTRTCAHERCSNSRQQALVACSYVLLRCALFPRAAPTSARFLASHALLRTLCANT
eukprot:scaffold50569_cov33-Tisochrysis_lutea.AAC.2